MRHIGLQKSSKERNQINKGIKNENQDLSEKINPNTLMLFYHPLYQETTKKFMSTIFQQHPHKIQIKFLQFIELNLRIQKVLIEKFSIEKAMDSALNDWNRELSQLNVQEHLQNSSKVKTFDIKYHYDSLNDLNISPSLPISTYSKLFDNLKVHSAFSYSQYCISIEVLQKFIFDISCNWCQFYDIELFCFFSNGITLNECSVKSLNQIQYISTPFFKEFNQVKQVYSRYIKKNLKDNFKIWCEWNFQRLNDICSSLVTRLSRIFQNDSRITEYPDLFKDALENFNKEIVHSTVQAQKIIENDQTEKNSLSHIEFEGDQKKQNTQEQTLQIKNHKSQSVQKQKSLNGTIHIDNQQVNEEEQDSDRSLDKNNAQIRENDQQNQNYMRQNSQKVKDTKIQDQGKLQIASQHCLNEVESQIIDKKLKQMSKLLEKQKHEIDEDSHQLKLAYRQAEKGSSNAFKYFQKLLHYKRDQQKKSIKNLQQSITNKMKLNKQNQELSPLKDNDTKQDVKNHQIQEDFFISNQTRLNTDIRQNKQEDTIGDYQQEQYSDLNLSQYQSKKRFLSTSPEKNLYNKTQLNQSLISPSQLHLENQRIIRDNIQRSICRQNSIISESQIYLSSEKKPKNSSKVDILNEQPQLDRHQIALSKAHQISPVKKSENIYDNSSLLPSSKQQQTNINSLRIHTHPQQVQYIKIIQYNKLQPMPLISPKINDSQIFNEKDKINDTPSLSTKNCFSEVEKIRLNESYRVNRISTTKTESDSPTFQPIQQTYNTRIHTEQDFYTFKNASNEQKQLQNLFNKNLINHNKHKKKTSLGDVINLNYLYRPNLTFSGECFQNKKQNESCDLSIDVKQIKPEVIQVSNSNQNNQRKITTGHKIRSQTIDLNEASQSLKGNQYTSINENSTINKQSGEQLKNSNLQMKQVQPQFTQKYRKLVSQSRNLWQKYLVEDELYLINDFDKLNNFLDEIRKTKNGEEIKQIIQKHFNQYYKQESERGLFHYKTPYNRKLEIPFMQGKNMKINQKI